MDLHEYNIVAENYDLYVNNLTRDSGLADKSCVKFHLDLADKYGHSKILDIACGTGVTSIPLLENNFQVHSLDISKEMISVLKSKIQSNLQIENKKSQLLVSDMKSFKIDTTFSLAMIPRSGFMHLLTSEDQRITLKNIHQHLSDDGILTLNTFDPNLGIITSSAQSDNYIKRTEFTNKKGHKVELYCSTIFIQENQRINSKWLFKEYENSEIILTEELPLMMRYTFRQEMIYLFELSGFKILNLYGDYMCNPASYPSQLIWVVKKI